MAVSVIISNLNGSRFLPRLLDSLNTQRGVEFEIIVVDRQSTDTSAEILRRHPKVKVVSEPPLTGLVAGYHRGVSEAEHEHLFFCNEDMWFDPDCLAALEKHIDLKAGIVAADPWQWTYDGQKWIHGGTRFVPSWWALASAFPFRRYDFTAPLPEGAVVPFPCAGAFLMHRKIYEEVGGWDVSLFLDNEDVDLFLRVWQRGWNAVAVPNAKVYHAVGMSNAQTVGPRAVPVSRRRYVANRVGKMLIPAKYFSTHSLWLGVANHLSMLANNLAKLRGRNVGMDLQALWEFLRRGASIRRFRAMNRSWTAQAPGERFFTATEFQASAGGVGPR